MFKVANHQNWWDNYQDLCWFDRPEWVKRLPKNHIVRRAYVNAYLMAIAGF